MVEEAIKVENLVKIYPGNVVAVNGISFSVIEGEVFGFLGPNGAGKTTTINILTTLLKPTKGRALVGGYDVVESAGRVREIIGYVPQDITVDDDLTGWENLMLQAKLYHVPKDVAVKRARELLEMLELSEAAHRKVETYSGGMRRRLELAEALLHRPKILFLDEPTLGLDVHARNAVWDYIKRLRDEYGMTIFLTTHYMEEADMLCDRVAIIDYGEIKAVGKPSELKSSVGGDVIEVEVKGPHNRLAEIVKKHVDGDIKSLTVQGSLLRVKARDGERLLPRLILALRDSGYEISSVSLRKPSLDEVFLEYTGRRLRDEEASREEFFRFRRSIRKRRG